MNQIKYVFDLKNVINYLKKELNSQKVNNDTFRKELEEKLKSQKFELQKIYEDKLNSLKAEFEEKLNTFKIELHTEYKDKLNAHKNESNREIN